MPANDPIAAIAVSCKNAEMKLNEPESTKEFVSRQRNAANVFLTLYCVLLMGFWLHSLADLLFELGWGSDSEALWMAPAMAAGAFGLRYFTLKIFGFVEKNY